MSGSRNSRGAGAAEATRGVAGHGLPPRNGGRTTTRAKYSITNREETQQSRVAPTHCSRGRRVCLPRGLKQAMQSEFERHMKAGTFSMVDRVPERRKPVDSKGVSTIKQTRRERSSSLNQG